MQFIVISALVSLFALQDGRLICEGSAVAQVDERANVHFDRSFGHAAVVDIDSKKAIVFDGCERKIEIPLEIGSDAIIPFVLLGSDAFMVIQPHILKAQLFDYTDRQITCLSPNTERLLYEPYIHAVVADSGILGAVAFRDGQKAILAVLSESGVKTVELGDWYPVGVWICGKDAFVRLLKVNNMRVSDEKVVKVNTETLEPNGEIMAKKALFMTCSDGFMVFASKKGHLYVVRGNGRTDQKDLNLSGNEIVVDAWSCGHEAFVLVGRPKFERNGYRFYNLRLFALDRNGEVESFELPSEFNGRFFGFRIGDNGQKVVLLNEFGAQLEVKP